MNLVVAGYAIRHPVVGNMMAYLHYVLGFHRLGHDVVYVEESGWENACFDPSTGLHSDDPRAGLRRTADLMSRLGFSVPTWYVNSAAGNTLYGTTRREFESTLRAADLVINVGGVCWLPEFRYARRRALVDLDPLFTQLGVFARDMLHSHDVHFTYGLNIGDPACRIPTAGVTWHPTLPPIVTSLWTGQGTPAPDRPFTTIANWRAFESIEYDGRVYGQKDQELLKLLDLPKATLQPLELALSGADEDVIELFEQAGWSVRDGGEISESFDSYLAYIVGSRAELSAAKHAYVATRSGWFSDRSATYLATGRPVVVQDTGFRDVVPFEGGVLTFTEPVEANRAIGEVNADYEAHASAARDLAGRTFDYTVVLPEMIEKAVDR